MNASTSAPYFQVDLGKFSYKNISLTLDLAVGEWQYLELSWNSATGTISRRINGGSWTTATGATGDDPAGANFILGSHDGVSANTQYDQVMITGGYQDDVYSLRNITSF